MLAAEFLNHHIMKNFAVIILFFISCHSVDPNEKNNKATSIEQTSVKTKFILDNILQGNNGDFVLFFIFPSFCGACNQTIMTFIDDFQIEGFQNIYIIPKEDVLKTNEYKLNYKNTLSAYDFNTLQKHGFRGSSNQIILVSKSKVIYESLIKNETIEEINVEISKVIGKKL